MKRLFTIIITAAPVAYARAAYAESGASANPYTSGIFIAIIVGVIIAFIVTAVMKAKLRSVREGYEAGDYVKADSLQLSRSGERFLFRNVTKVPIQKNTNAGGGHGPGSAGGASSGVNLNFGGNMAPGGRRPGK